MRGCSDWALHSLEGLKQATCLGVFKGLQAADMLCIATYETQASL